MKNAAFVVFKKELNRIFGFNIKSKNFDDNPNETEYEKINREYFEKVENKNDIYTYT